MPAPVRRVVRESQRTRTPFLSLSPVKAEVTPPTACATVSMVPSRRPTRLRPRPRAMLRGARSTPERRLPWVRRPAGNVELRMEGGAVPRNGVDQGQTEACQLCPSGWTGRFDVGQGPFKLSQRGLQLAPVGIQSVLADTHRDNGLQPRRPVGETPVLRSSSQCSARFNNPASRAPAVTRRCSRIDEKRAT